MLKKKVVFIVGPTSVGKTDVSVLLAQDMSGQIVNADAMQVYQEVSIVNNKPGPKVVSKVPHHLIGFVSVTETFDVAAYNQRALEAIQEICQRGKIPIVVGGSGLYIRVLLDGIFQENGKNPQVRRRLEEQACQGAHQELYARLKRVDPQAAVRIHPHDIKRVVRALEVYETLHQPISRLQKSHTGLWQRYPVYLFCLNRERSQLYERIHRRVEQMFEAGLVDEIRNLSALKLSRSAHSIIGIQEVQGYLRREYDLEHAKDLMKLHTRHYAKRQLTWFRKEQRLQWIMIQSQETAGDVMRKILNMIERGKRKTVPERTRWV